MMRVILAKTAGFCYGVERAVALAHETAKAHGGAMLGSVIHNDNVVAELEREGMRLIASPEEATHERRCEEGRDPDGGHALP